ncbi:MAG: MBL fold metallo-hydrolase [Gaiellaceae bacterium]
MRLTVVGCSPSWPNPGGAHSGYLVEAQGDRLLLDCGPGVLSRLRLAEPWPRVDGIVLTHLHLDHAGDLGAWLWGLLSGPACGLAGPELWIPHDSRRELDRFAPSRFFAEAFTLREYAEHEPFTVAGFSLSARRVPHYNVSAFALRVERAGKVLAYSGDSAPSDALVETARDADLFLCEATLAQSELPGLVGHLTAADAQEMARRADARRLVLVHRSVERPSPEGVETAYDGLVVEL